MTVVVTAQGRVRGVREEHATVFRGIPYAAAPFGPRRFDVPRPPEPWEGVRDATAFGPTAPKHPYRPPLSELLPDPDAPGDDCLNLNVWTPDPAGGPYPVMVWIHGGSFCHGSNRAPVYDGTAFARDGVVLVSVNYRLGVEGFAVLPDAPANLGLRDQIAALEWVRDNIHAFGGDPGSVTVFGESAGAVSVAALLTAPRAAGLCRRAVLQSGAPTAMPPDRAGRATRAIADRLGVPATAAALRTVPVPRLLDAQRQVLDGGNPITGGPGFHLAVDGDVLPEHPAAALADGASADVDLLMGTTTEEYRLWFVPGGLTERVSPLALRLAMLKKRVPRSAARTYRRHRPGATPGEILGALATDLLLRVPQNRLADARRPGRTFLYEFAWPTPVQGLGACHALELGFVFDTLRSADVRALTGPDAPQALADAVHAAWVEFAKTGSPGWEAWSAARPVMTYDATGGRLVHAPREAERRLWDSHA
ncbi:carboxylesterase/lipase family protein [Streptomyces sp. G45]|uniref:carboxylesterase/lipase family protein n=1 Tax=Streptomyces sp. G45 TaxID=3406627 RepID=UPI003C1AE411